MVFDIYDIVFYQLLGFDPASSFLTGDLVHDLLYGIIIPVIFLFFIVDSFAVVMFRNKLRHLVAVATIGVIITGGWYPIIAEITSQFFVILLIISILIWFKTRIHGKEGIFNVSVDKEYIKGHLKWDDVKNKITGGLYSAIERKLDSMVLLAQGRTSAALTAQREYDVRIAELKSIKKKYGKKAEKEIKNKLDGWVSHGGRAHEGLPEIPDSAERILGRSKDQIARDIAATIKADLGV